jgi:hypothetical protein
VDSSTQAVESADVQNYRAIETSSARIGRGSSSSKGSIEMYRCNICSATWETIPDGAVEILSRNQSYVYRFVDGTVHDLRRVTPKRQQSQATHTRWHKTKTKPECVFCFSPTEPEASPDPPVEQTELLTEVMSVLAELPEPPSAPVAVAVAPEPRPNTSMAAAFHRLFK